MSIKSIDDTPDEMPMKNKLRWFVSVLWRVPLTLLIAIIGFILFAVVVSATKDKVVNEWRVLTNFPKLVEHYDRYLSSNEGTGLYLQNVKLNDDYLIYYEGGEYEHYVFTLDIPNDSKASTFELYSKEIPNDFSNVTLYRLKEDPGIYAIDPHFQHDHSTNILQYIVFTFFLIVAFAMGIGVFIERGLRVWKNHIPLSGTAETSKILARDTNQEAFEDSMTYGWSTWFVWLSLLTLLSITIVTFGWADIPVTQREWRDLLVHTFIAATNIFMVLFFIEIFSARKCADKGIAQNRPILFFPSVAFTATLLFPLFSWAGHLYRSIGD